MNSTTLALVACGRTLPSPGISARSGGELSTDMQKKIKPDRVYNPPFPCSCSVVYSGAISTIKYCSVHEQAHQLLVALKLLKSWAAGLPLETVFTIPDKTFELVGQAILKAEGGGK